MKTTFLSLLAAFALTAFLVGCGGDDDNKNNGSSSAPETLNGQIYSVTDASGTGNLNFTSASAFELTKPGETTVQSGTYTSTRTGNTYTVAVNLANGKSGTLTLSFDGTPLAGHWSLSVTGDPTLNGTFASTSNPGGSTAGTTAGGTTTGATAGTTAGSTSGATAGTTASTTAGATAGTTSGTGGSSGGPFAGKSITFSIQSGLTEGTSFTVVFSGAVDQGTFRSSVGHTGRYLYGSVGNAATLTLFYDQHTNGASNPDTDVFQQINLGGQTFEGLRTIGNDSGHFTGTFTLQ